MVSFSPPLISPHLPHQPRVISEGPCPVLPDVSQDIALSRVRVPAKKLMLDFAASPNRYKAAASRNKEWFEGQTAAIETEFTAGVVVIAAMRNHSGARSGNGVKGFDLPM